MDNFHKENARRIESIIDDNAKNILTVMADSSPHMMKDKTNVSLMLEELRLKEIQLVERINSIQNDTANYDSIENLIDHVKKCRKNTKSVENLRKFQDKLDLFHLFTWRLCLDSSSWKLLAYSIYRLRHLIDSLDNYEVKEYILEKFHILFSSFKVFIIHILSIHVKSEHRQSKLHENASRSVPITESRNTSKNAQEILFESQPDDQIEQDIHDLQSHQQILKESLVIAQERFNVCQVDNEIIEKISKVLNSLEFTANRFDKQDQENIHLLELKENVSQKCNRNDLIKLKIFIDNQIKQLVELNKQNAAELQRLKLFKSASSETRHIQTVVSVSGTSFDKKHTRAHSYQSSKPYISFELDDIRKYQGRALLKSPYGTIPLYRRQAWAAANLLPGHSLHLLRYIENSLETQIHSLLGNNYSNLCNSGRQQKSQKSASIEIFNSTQDISIVGSNNKIYRGRIDSCQVIPLKRRTEKKSTAKTNSDENNEITKINIDQLDQTSKKLVDEHLFEYLDWERQFAEQDLPFELCEELFNHWKLIICEDQLRICNSKSKSLLFQSKENGEQNSINAVTDSLAADLDDDDNDDDDRCICSECSCSCEKYLSDKSVCLCSQCSCACLSDTRSENGNTFQNATEISDKNVSLLQIDNTSQDQFTNETNLNEKFDMLPSDSMLVSEEHTNDENMAYDPFINRTDDLTQQYDVFQSTFKVFVQPDGNQCSKVNDHSDFQSTKQTAVQCSLISNSLQLDDPTWFRQKILDRHRQRNRH